MAIWRSLIRVTLVLHVPRITLDSMLIFCILCCSFFFFWRIEGTRLYMQCDINVCNSGKKRHECYILMAQRVEAILITIPLVPLSISWYHATINYLFFHYCIPPNLLLSGNTTTKQCPRCIWLPISIVVDVQWKIHVELQSCPFANGDPINDMVELDKI
jgi:hypothetical protein